MNIYDIIKCKYGSVDKMIEQTNLSISRGYLYQILAGNRQNLTLQVMEELKNALGLDSLDAVKEVIENAKDQQTFEEIQ